MRRLYEIANDERAVRLAIRILIDKHEKLFDEKLRYERLRAFLNDEDQECKQCHGKLEKRRTKTHRLSWICKKCKKKNEINNRKNK